MINWLREVDSSLWGVFMSIIMAVLRIVRDKEEDKFFRIAVEALLCGAITFTHFLLSSSFLYHPQYYYQMDWNRIRQSIMILNH